VRIFKRPKPPEQQSEASQQLSGLFEKLVRQQAEKPKHGRNPYTGDPLDLNETYNPFDVKFR
jgi:hypothetical protein